MECVVLGGDVSKGYVDFRCLSPEGSVVREWSRRYDDTPVGHAAVRSALPNLLQQFPEARLRVGLECSGGLERNWLSLFTDCLEAPHQVYQLNALAVKRFRDRDLHGSVTDPRSALTIAQYLRTGLRTADRPYAAALEGLTLRYRTTCNRRERGAEVRNELQSLLPVVHPGLVQYCRKGVPDWVLTLLLQYPTAGTLAGAQVAAVARLDQVTPRRAELLIAAAQGSVGALQDPDTGAVVSLLVEEIHWLDMQVAAAKASLITRFTADPVVRRLCSIPGIGPWTAVVLRLEIGDFNRFGQVASLIAFAGLDPAYHRSGDGEVRHGISKRGRSGIRAALYMAVLTGLRYNPPVRAYYHRLIARGKLVSVALTACMAKLLRIAYACVTTECDFAPHYEAERAAARTLAATPAGGSPPLAERVPSPVAATTATPAPPLQVEITAPVSWREAKKRRAANTPPAGKTREARGHAAARADDTPSTSAEQLLAPPRT